MQEWDLNIHRVQFGEIVQKTLMGRVLIAREKRARLNSLLVSTEKIGSAVKEISDTITEFLVNWSGSLETSEVPNIADILEKVINLELEDDDDRYFDMIEYYKWKEVALLCFSKTEFNDRSTWLYAYYYYVVLSKFLAFFKIVIQYEDEVESIKEYRLTQDSTFNDFKTLVNDDLVDYLNSSIDVTMLNVLVHPFVRNFVDLMIENDKSNTLSLEGLDDFITSGDRAVHSNGNRRRVSSVMYKTFLSFVLGGGSGDVAVRPSHHTLLDMIDNTVSRRIISVLLENNEVTYLNLVTFVLFILETILIRRPFLKEPKFGSIIKNEIIELPDEQSKIWITLLGQATTLKIDMNNGICSFKEDSL